MVDKEPSYKEIHGTTRVGDFLRSIGKSDILLKVLGSTTQAITGDVKGALETLFKNSDELSEAEREYSLKLLESDLKENEEVTKRWDSDMNSDSFLSKNVRPILLMFLTFMMTLIAILDSSIENFVVDVEWITLLRNLLITGFVAYFGGRSYEKTKKL